MLWCSQVHPKVHYFLVRQIELFPIWMYTYKYLSYTTCQQEYPINTCNTQRENFFSYLLNTMEAFRGVVYRGLLPYALPCLSKRLAILPIQVESSMHASPIVCVSDSYDTTIYGNLNTVIWLLYIVQHVTT